MPMELDTKLVTLLLDWHLLMQFVCQPEWFECPFLHNKIKYMPFCYL